MMKSRGGEERRSTRGGEGEKRRRHKSKSRGGEEVTERDLKR